MTSRPLRHIRSVGLALILMGGPAFGQAPDPGPAPIPAPVPVVPMAVISAPAKIPAGSPYLVVLGDESVSKGPLSWSLVSPRGTPFKVFGGECLVIKDPVPGVTYKIALLATGDGQSVAFDMAEVVVGKTPTPKPPTPTPGPTPDPGPSPGPAPTPPPIPDAIGNLRVVLLYESSQKMTPAQVNTIFSTVGIVPYLNRKTIKDVEGRPSWRMWDKDTDVSLELPEWQEAMKAAKADPVPLPKLCVFAGNTLAAAHPIVSEADALAFLKAKGGE